MKKHQSHYLQRNLIDLERKTLFLDFLNPKTLESDLEYFIKDHFKKPFQIRIVRNPTGDCKGFGYVTFSSRSDALKAKKILHGANVCQSIIRARFSKAKKLETQPKSLFVELADVSYKNFESLLIEIKKNSCFTPYIEEIIEIRTGKKRPIKTFFVDLANSEVTQKLLAHEKKTVGNAAVTIEIAVPLVSNTKTVTTSAEIPDFDLCNVQYAIQINENLDPVTADRIIQLIQQYCPDLKPHSSKKDSDKTKLCLEFANEAELLLIQSLLPVISVQNRDYKYTIVNSVDKQAPKAYNKKSHRYFVKGLRSNSSIGELKHRLKEKFKNVEVDVFGRRSNYAVVTLSSSEPSETLLASLKNVFSNNQCVIVEPYQNQHLPFFKRLHLKVDECEEKSICEPKKKIKIVFNQNKKINSPDHGETNDAKNIDNNNSLRLFLGLN